MATERGQSNIPLLRIDSCGPVSDKAKSDVHDFETEVSSQSANFAQPSQDTSNLTDSVANTHTDSELCARASDKVGPEMTSEDAGVPYDKGWAWMVVLGEYFACLQESYYVNVK